MTCLWRQSTLFNRPESHTKSRQNVLVIILYSRILSLLYFLFPEIPEESWNGGDLPVIYYISDQLMNMINTVKYLLNVKRIWYFPLEITEKKYIYNASSVYLECYCCHAGLVRRWISILVLKERNKEQLTQDIIGTDNTGLKSFTQNKGWKRYGWNWSFCIDWSINGRNNEYM